MSKCKDILQKKREELLPVACGEWYHCCFEDFGGTKIRFTELEELEEKDNKKDYLVQP